MTLDLFHAEAVTGTEPVGPRHHRRHRQHPARDARLPRAAVPHAGSQRPNVDQAGDRAPRVRQGLPPLRHRGAQRAGRPEDATRSTSTRSPSLIDDNTVALVGSACNYGYGTIDPIEALSDLALQHGIGLHVDGCLGGFILPFGQELGYDIPRFDFRVPGVTSISADTHKYGYAFKGTSVLAFRDKALRNGQYFFLTGWTGGKYCSPGIEGSRSGGLLAATWAAMVSLGREGYRSYAQGDLRDRGHHEGRGAVASRAAHHGRPDVRVQLHVRRVRHLPRQRLHADREGGASTASSTRTRSTWPSPDRRPSPASPRRSPRTSPTRSRTRCEHKAEAPKSGAIYGGVAGGLTDEADEFIRAVMADMMDAPADRPALTPEAAPAATTDRVGRPRRALRPRRRPRHRRAQGRARLAHRAGSPGTTTARSRPAGCRAAARSRTPTSGGT